MSYTDKVIISWDKLAQDCEVIAHQIKASGSYPEKMLAVTRGGLVVAGLISRALGMKNIETIGLESYDEQNVSGEIKRIKEADSAYLKKTLVVDDLVDQGQTFQYLRSITTDCVFACLYSKPNGKAQTDFCVEDFAQDQWIEFPWESFENQFLKVG